MGWQVLPASRIMQPDKTGTKEVEGPWQLAACDLADAAVKELSADCHLSTAYNAVLVSAPISHV